MGKVKQERGKNESKRLTPWTYNHKIKYTATTKDIFYESF